LHTGDAVAWHSETRLRASVPIAPVTLVLAEPTSAVASLPGDEPTPDIADLGAPSVEWFSDTPFDRPGAVTPATLVFVEPTTALALETSTLTTAQSSTPAPPVAEVVASYRGAEPGQSTERAVANSDGDFSLGRQLGLGVSRIVIDPGHGGYDPGAQTGGLTESALVLDVATRLAARLKAETDIEVILTRRRDAYMPLRARTELANRVGADLFLSIHANAARDRTARGIETYYLDLATTADTQMVAARENAASRDGMHDLSELVQSITLHNKLDESRDLAEIVQRHLVRAVRELHPDAQDLGVKQAPFVVLIGANMPSVLAEISFLTNQEDAAFLATDAYRNKIAEALLQSILEYQRTLKPETNFVAGNN
jgi:N-acetylmuramoyl-L-alanine amidase